MNKSVSALLALLFGGVCSLTISGCSSNMQANSVASTTTPASTYDQVLKSGKIRCGYVLYVPGCIKDPNTHKLSGIGPDTLEKIASKLGLQVEWTEEVGWGSMLEGLQSGRYDMVVTPVWTNANRAKLVDFSKPLFYSPVCAYVRQGDHRFDKGLSGINSPAVSVATIDGETAEVVAQSDFPKSRKVSLPQLTDVSQLLMTVSSQKADITFTEPATAVSFIKNNPNSIEAIVTQRPVRIFPNCWMYKRNQGEFKNMVDIVMDELINDGTVNTIVAKYEPAPGTLYRVAPSYQLPYEAKVASTGKDKAI
jgi:polar amino acid transport system substrate-binding protein